MRRFMTTAFALELALLLTSGADREPPPAAPAPPPVQVALVEGPLC